VSPLATDLQSGGATGPGYRNLYGSFLPRPAQDFTAGAFGPFSPILPVPIDAPEPSGRSEPRREQYQVGWNLPTGTPGDEGTKLASFAVLQTLADLYSVARACIQLRKNEIRGLNWDVLPTKDASKAMRGSDSQLKDFGKRRGEALKFFRHPDPDYFSWGSWIDAVMEEILVFDALSIHLSPKWGKGMGKGLLGSDLDSLNLLSGPTIKPLYDLHGASPRPPAPAYSQYQYSVPRTDMISAITGRDIEEAGLTDDQWGQYRGDQLLYLPMLRQRQQPYGKPPVERALIPVMSGLQKQGFALDYFREGTVPSVYISPGDISMTPNQIRELQDALNAVAGDPAWHHKIIVLPPGSKTFPQRDAALADQFDEVVMNQVCMAFDVMPMEIGISPKVSTTQTSGAANQMAKQSQSTQSRKSTVPTLRFLADIMDFVLHHVCGQDDMRFTFEGLEEDEDAETLTSLLVTQVGAGLASIDEAREELGKNPWGLPETSDPLWASATGVQSLETALAPPAPPVLPPGMGGQPAIPGQKPQQALPAGKPAAKPAGDGNAGQSPGHEQAEAADDAAGTGGKARPAAKAVRAELEALARHLRKGRRITTWEARHIPGAVMAGISEDLAKGLTVTQAVDIAAAITLTKDTDGIWGKAGEQGPKAGAAQPQPDQEWPGWELDLALVAIVTAALLAAFAALLPRWRILLAEFASGELAVTPDVLAEMITADTGTALEGVLPDAWAQGMALGQQSALALLAHAEADWGGWQPGDADAARELLGEGLRNLLAQWGIDGIKSIEDTRLGDLAAEISQAVRDGDAPSQLVPRIEGILRLPERAEMIARTEIARAVTAGAIDSYTSAGVTEVDWLAEPDACPVCKGNADASPQHILAVWPGGVPAPPQHPACRCSLSPAAMGDISLKVMRRRVDTNGQESWRDEPDMQDAPAGGGAASVRPHDADGIQAELKAAKPWKHPDPDLSTAEQVHAQLAEDFPESALAFVMRAKWTGPADVPLADIDFANQKAWAASHEPAKVERFRKRIAHRMRKGKVVKPVVLARMPGGGDLVVLDGHHRALACKQLSIPVSAYTGTVPAADVRAATEMHASQREDDSPGSTAAEKSGNAETLREYWTHEAHGGPTHFAGADAVAWGTPGDFDRCVAAVEPHLGEGAKGYCNLEHHRALGYWPAQHAEMEGK
jgi:SPP1 gp7 family putative phage head morphogenesis protein